MKKNVPYLIVIAICVLITITAVAVACANAKPASAPEGSTTDGIESTVTEALDIPTHNASSETTTPESTTATETEEPTETTQKPTEAPITETEEPTEAPTDPPVVIETEEPEEIIETEKETEPPAPVISLEYQSNGNGTCSVTGIGNVTDTYVAIPEKSPEGDVVTAIESDAFYGNLTLRAVEIPSTVATIGEMAFADCPELVYISVSKSNRHFTDVGGVLYSIDMEKLLAFPSASGASSISIPLSVEYIAAMAFYGCENLQAIHYEGTLSEWSKLEVGEMNYGLYTASIVCSDTK